MKARLLMFAYRIRMTGLAKNYSCPLARGPVPRVHRPCEGQTLAQKRLVPRSAGACPPRASALRGTNPRTTGLAGGSVCSLSSPELKQNPRYPEPDQNDGPSQKLFAPRSAGACPPLASEPDEGQALALRNRAMVSVLGCGGMHPL